MSRESDTATFIRDARAVFEHGDADALRRLLTGLNEFGSLDETLGTTAGRLMCHLIAANRIDAVATWLQVAGNACLRASGWTPVADALARASSHMLRTVLDHIKDSTLVNSILEAACAVGCDENVRILLEDGRVNPNTLSGMALFQAIKKDHVSTVRVLLEFGAVPTIVACNQVSSVEMMRLIAPVAPNASTRACLLDAACSAHDDELLPALLEYPHVQRDSVSMVRAYVMSQTHGYTNSAKTIERTFHDHHD